eukprot:SAG25_NODE_479_length_7519_cov_4.794340_4_plen_78_part_00
MHAITARSLSALLPGLGGSYDAKADLWGVGGIMFSMLTKQLVWGEARVESMEQLLRFLAEPLERRADAGAPPAVSAY